jgi:type VI protein secretion system component VasK
MKISVDELIAWIVIAVIGGAFAYFIITSIPDVIRHPSTYPMAFNRLIIGGVALLGWAAYFWISRWLRQRRNPRERNSDKQA